MNILRYQILVSAIHGKHKKLYKITKKIIRTNTEGEFEQRNGPKSISDIPDYFEYIINMLEKLLIMS